MINCAQLILYIKIVFPNASRVVNQFLWNDRPFPRNAGERYLSRNAPSAKLTTMSLGKESQNI